MMGKRYHFEDDKLHVETVQDVEPFVNHAAALRGDVREVPGLGYYAGTIPEVIVLQYMKENGVTFEQVVNDSVHIHRILTNPDYKKFRVWEGNPGRGKD